MFQGREENSKCPSMSPRRMDVRTASPAFGMHQQKSGRDRVQRPAGLSLGRLLPAVCLLTLLGSGFQIPAAAQELSALEERAIRETAAQLNASVVQIQTVGGLDRVGSVRTGTAPTTGLIVSADGYIVSSAFNFASKPASVLVILPDGRRLPAKHVADDLSRMLTLLKVDADGLTVATGFPHDQLRVGQWSIALGRTYASDFPSVSVGVISALNRVWGKAIQTDAKVSPVNYGGPLCSIDGRVMGVLVPLSPSGDTSTAGVEWYDSGIGFAIPMRDVLVSVERMKAGETLHRGLIGVTFKSKSPNGSTEIANVRPASPADEAGLQPGDVFVEVAGSEVTRQAQVKTLLGPLYAGEEVDLTVKRKAERIEVRVKLVAELVPYERPALGILAERSSGPETAGVPIRHVIAGSAAAEAGLARGEQVTKYNGIPVTDAAQLRAAVDAGKVGDDVTVEIKTAAGETREVSFALRVSPDAIPNALATDALEPGQVPEDLETGRFVVELEAHDREYWAFVPEDFNPQHQYGLMVWLHPPGDTMEATVIRQWKAVAERRGLLLIGPKSNSPRGWNPSEAEFVRDAVSHFQTRYAVDPSRIFVHAYAGSGQFAYHLAFNEREWVRGVAVSAAPLRTQVAPHDPDFRLLTYLHWIDGGGGEQPMQDSVKLLQTLKYPVSTRIATGSESRYLNADEVDELGRWADMLDRI